MTTPRVAPLDVDAAKKAAETAGVPDYLAELSVFRVALHNPNVASALNSLLHHLLWQGSFDTRLRELIIMRLGWTTGSEYEWTQHWRVATQLGIDEQDLLAVRDWRSSDRFGAVEAAVLAATDETIADGTISDVTWAACSDVLGGDPALLVELVAVIGNWRLFSALLRSLAVPLEDGVESWPPDGRRPG